MPYLTERFGNPSSSHSFGQEAHLGLNSARQTVAAALGAPQESVIFTGGASEAINTALKGLAHARRQKGMHIVASSFEHSTTLATLAQLAEEGWEVTYVTPERNGMVSVEAFLAACREDTSLATLLYVQNELGTIQPVAEIGAALEKRGIAFHVDAAQAFGTADCHVDTLHADTLVLAPHKFHGPKGIGILYIRPGLEILSLVNGTQEFGMRAGTQNVAYAVGVGEAVRLALAEKEMRLTTVQALYTKASTALLSLIAETIVNSNGAAPHILSVTFPGTSGESLLRRLDLEGIAVSTAAACAAGSGRVSHVLTAIGIPEELAQATLRISFSHENTMEELDTLVTALAFHVGQIRHMNITY